MAEEEAAKRMGIPDRGFWSNRVADVAGYMEKMVQLQTGEDFKGKFKIAYAREFGVVLDTEYAKEFEINTLQQKIIFSQHRRFEIEQATGVLEERRYATLLQTKQVMDSTAESLMSLQKSPVLTSKDLSGIIDFSGDALNRSREMNAKYQTGITSMDAYDPAKKLKMEQEYALAKETLTADIKNETMAVERLVAARTEEARVAKEMMMARASIRKLQITAEDNPFVKIYDQAADRMISFKDQFKSATSEMILDATAASNKIRELELFKTGFGLKQKLGGLFDEEEKLRGGLGGADRRSKAAGIEAQGDVLKKAITEAMLSGNEFGTGGRRDLLNQYEHLGMTSPADRLANEAKDRGLKLGQDALLAAGADKGKQGFALDQILSATSNIGGLSTDQIDVRMKALEQKSGLEKDTLDGQAKKETMEFHAKVLKLLEAKKDAPEVRISLKDDSGGALRAEMGQAPTPESSGAVSSPFHDTTAAFRNDPMSGRL